MKWRDVVARYDVGVRHSPSQFYPNSFRIEAGPNRMHVVGIVKRHVGKNFRVVAVIKRCKT